MNIHNEQALVPNTKISSGRNSYTIKKVLGLGSFGIIYLAVGSIKIHNVSFEVPFAIKEHLVQSCYRDKNGSKVLYTPSLKHKLGISDDETIFAIQESPYMQYMCGESFDIFLKYAIILLIINR